MRPVARAQYLSIFGDVPQGREVLTVLEAVRKVRKKTALKAAARKAKSKVARKGDKDSGAFFGGRAARGKVAKGRKKGRLPAPPKDAPQKDKPSKQSGGASTHNPFRHSSSLGPTTIHKLRPPSPPPAGTRSHGETGCWKCTREGSYAQKCVGKCKKNKGKVIHIKIDKAYKKRYNKAFKAHRTLKRSGKRPE